MQSVKIWHKIALKKYRYLGQGIVKYKSGGVVYAYYITRIYRNAKGKPTNDRISIGKIDAETGLYDVIKRKFRRMPTIIALAEYMLCEGNVMSYYEDRHDEVYPHNGVKLGSAEISRVFQSIDYKSRLDFSKHRNL